MKNKIEFVIAPNPPHGNDVDIYSSEEWSETDAIQCCGYPHFITVRSENDKNEYVRLYREKLRLQIRPNRSDEEVRTDDQEIQKINKTLESLEIEHYW